MTQRALALQEPSILRRVGKSSMRIKVLQAKDNVGRSKSFQHHFASSSEQQEPRALEKWAYWETEEENIFIAD
jgi:hypothetical protein